MALQQTIGAVSYIFADISPGNGWDTEVAAFPTLSLMILSGPSINPDKLTLVGRAQDAGVDVLGYVHTTFGARSIAEVKTDIDTHFSYYGVNGIFVDQVDNTGSGLAYYTELYNYIKAKPGGGIVALNPGAKTVEAYAAIADHIMVAETNATNYRNRTVQMWEYDYPASKFWHVIHSCLESELEEMVILSRQRNAGILFVTNDVLPNPYDTVPSFWDDFIDLVEAGNAGGLAEPSFPTPEGFGEHIPPTDGGNDQFGMGGVTAINSSEVVIDSPYLVDSIYDPPRNTATHTWKLCPFSTAYDKYWIQIPVDNNRKYIRSLADGSLTYTVSKEIEPPKMFGTSTNITYVRPLVGQIGTEDYNATEHTSTFGKMRYHERGWICLDDACYHYTELGRRYHEI